MRQKKFTNIQIPQTKKSDVIDKINGISIADLYRWLEDDNKDIKDWVETQNQFTISSLQNGDYKFF